MLGAGICIPSHAQYVGRVDANKDAKTPTLRATAVLEYTGDLAKPQASRLIPLAVWDGTSYQPGGLYMAQPIPMTVESGTQYELELAGVPKGFYDVKAAADVSGSWIAIGSYQSPAAVRASKLRPSRVPPHVVHDAGYDEDKPHFAHRPADENTTPASGSGPADSKSSAPPVDPDRPQLHRRTDSTSSTNGNSNGSGSTPDTPAGTASASKSNAPDVDPDRPTLHRHDAASANSSDNGAPVSATMDVDPDRPKLRRGRPANQESLDVNSTVEIAKLAGHQEQLEQMVAVSDAKSREPHNFVYSWTDPADEKKMQASLEVMAKNLIAGKPAQPPISSTPAKKQPAAPANRTGVHNQHRLKAAPALPDLADQQFHAYALTFGGGATLVFTAKSTMADGKVKYVAIIAQPDFNGVPQVVFKQVTSDDELDVLPRMSIVDAADTDADNRGELIFAMTGKTDRQYAIYRVADRSVEQVFSTAGSS